MSRRDDAGRTASDDGRPDPRLAAALAADDGSPARRSEVWAALAGARVFLALEARAVARETSPATGLVQESEATMVLLGIGAPSGARALPAFLDGHEVQRWQPRARPVPLSGPAGCRTVLDDGAQALLLDPHGAAVAVSGFELGEIAAGRVPVPGAALAGARVFLALEARAVARETSPATGLVQESEATMVLLGIGSPSGARALPAFLDGHEVQRWQARARPVPLSGPAGCRTVLDDGAQALLLDPHGAAVAVSGFELGEIAAGRVPVPGAALSTRRVEADRVEPGGVSGEADARLVAAVARSLRPEPEVRAARLLPGPDGPVLGVWVPSSAGSEPAAVDLVALASRVRERLGIDLPAGGMDLTLIGEHGGGRPVPLRGRLTSGRRLVPRGWRRDRR